MAAWIPDNYKASSSKNRDENVFKFRKKKKGVKGAISSIKDNAKEIKPIK